MNLILASTSPYRAALLAKLRLPFTQVDPDYIEAAIEVPETPAEMAARLALGKARAAAKQARGARWIIIGSDQVASIGDRVLGKPGGFERAFDQLKASSGNWVSFHTAIALVSDEGSETVAVDCYEIRFRELSDATITRYLELEQPYDCAGSIKAEALGIALLAESRGRDVNTLYGLPLMLLTEMMAKREIDLIAEIN